MSEWAAKRFWTSGRSAREEGGGFGVHGWMADP